MNLSFQDLEALLRRLLPLRGSDHRQIDIAYRYFKRMGFPSGRPAGRGSRQGLEFESVLQLALAFELMNTVGAPRRVARTVDANWRWMAKSLAVAWLTIIEQRDARGVDVFYLQPNTIELGASEDRGDDIFEHLVPVARRSLQNWLASPDPDQTSSWLVIDPILFVGRTRRGLEGLAGATLATIDECFAELGEAAFGRPRSVGWLGEANFEGEMA